ncbi:MULTISPECIES: alpha/beta hydrolase [unclassified Streptomyces]|jgi:pimeloyl-ACP methyl ester carboxylesterase|uniref:alpha/beta fold hydrolase n=1 Tax=unclassified Streptomyces TaxID=2593676 RepID=UPI00344AE0C3
MTHGTADLLPVGAADLREDLRRLRRRGLRYACRVVSADGGRGGLSGGAVAEPLLLLGGALQDMYAWPRLERYVAPYTPVVLVDLPGTGVADDLPAHEGFDTLADAALHLLDELGLPRVNVLGASYGVPIAYRMAQRCPGRVSRLLLAGATHRVTDSMRAFLWEAVSHIERSAPAPGESLDGPCAANGVYADRLVRYLVNTAEQERVRQSAAVQRLLRRQALRTTWRQSLRHAACHRRVLEPALLPAGGIEGVPTLVFTGEYDITTSPEQNSAVAATIPGSRLALLKDADHMAHLECDAEYADLVLRFLRGQSLEGLAYCDTYDVAARG